MKTQTSPFAREAEARALTLDLLEILFRATIPAQCGFRLWDGTLWPDDTPRASTIVLQQPGALRSLLLPSHELAMTDAYIRGDIDLTGSVDLLVELMRPVWSQSAAWRRTLRAAHSLQRLPPTQAPAGGRGPAQLTGKLHSIERDRAAVQYHFDVSNEFFCQWLDPRMQYSAACFTAADQDLAAAQTEKLARVCRTLDLQPGQRLLDLGCGWGGLVLYAAEHYGVDATGITVSAAQAALANERIAAAGLAGRARVLLRDYRELERATPYDALVSVNMAEHVGEDQLPAYFEIAHWALRPGGNFLYEGISRHAWKKPEPIPNFRDSFIFPDGELVPIGVTLQAAEDAGFEVRRVENLREHYALTMRHWVRRLEAQHAACAAAGGEDLYRIWRLHLSYSVHSFASGRQNVHQALLVKGDGSSSRPLTREEWNT